ncbi:MAG: GHKL domain-containing protein [Lachnospiraceae bacterium]|nr:GHKL domain-containing protein [Lachnospiraceae bacterium]
MNNIICYALCFLVEGIIFWQYASHLFSPKNSFHTRIILLGVLYSLLFLVSLWEISWLNMGLYIVANFLFLITQYDIRIHFALFYSAVLAAVMGMCELSVYSMFERFTPHFYEQVEYFHNKILFIILSKILFFIVIFVLTHLLKGGQKYNEQHDCSVYLLIFIPVTTVFIMLVLVSISDTCVLSPTQSWMVSISAVFLLATNLLVFGINHYNQKKNVEYTEMQLLLQKETDSTEYYKMLLSQNENQSILIHDIKKHLQSIELLNDQCEQEKIGEYIRQLMDSSGLKEISRICDHELLNAILSRYNRQCCDNRITFLTDIRSGSTNFIADNDLTSLFCNLLDNAFDAAKRVENSFIEVNIRKREKTPFIAITIINSCRVTPFTGFDGKLLTTKPNKHQHGFGMKSIRKIVNQYCGDMQMYFNEDSRTFHTIITLKHSDNR